MMRIFKPRSPISMGAWCLAAFSNAAVTAVAADVLGRPRAARALGGGTAALGTYLGSYTGALLATTAVPVWSRSRLFPGPFFIATATAMGAAANRLVLAASGLPAGHPTRRALGTVETTATTAELAMSSLNERPLGRISDALEEGARARCSASLSGRCGVDWVCGSPTASAGHGQTTRPAWSSCSLASRSASPGFARGERPPATTRRLRDGSSRPSSSGPPHDASARRPLLALAPSRWA